MIYDIELFNGSLLSIELEEMEFGSNKYDYKISNFIKLLENLGCDPHINDLRQHDGYALITMTLPEALIEQANKDEDEFLSRIEEVVMMIFLEDGPARYLPPIFPSDTSIIGELTKELNKISEILKDMTPDEQSEEVNKVIERLGLSDIVEAQIKESTTMDGQGDLTESMNDLLVEVKHGTFSIFGFSGPLTDQLNKHYDIDFSKIAIEISDNVFKPVDYTGSIIEFDDDEQLLEWASERFQIY